MVRASRAAWLLLGTAVGLGATAFLAAPASAGCAPAAPVALTFFTDVNSNALSSPCLPFAHSDWAGNAPTYLETVGAGVCVADYNNDGKLDAYLTNGEDPNGTSPSALFRNDGTSSDPFRFTNVTASAHVGRVGWSTGCAWGDYDNDGWPDLYVAGYGNGTLYHNNHDGTFTDVTISAGVANDQCGVGTRPCWGSSVAWLDYDHSGRLSLFIANYIDLTNVNGGLQPGLYNGLPNTLYRNDGPDANGTWHFTDVSAQAGIESNGLPGGSKSLGVAVVDYDGDGWPDLLVANDEDRAALYHNNHDGTFTDEASSTGLVDSEGNMGVAWGDFDGNGHPSALITHFDNLNNQNQEHTALWHPNGNGGFQREEDAYGLDTADPNDNGYYIGWGTGFVDFDNSGYPGVFIANGDPQHGKDLAPEPGQLFQWSPSAGKWQWVNNGTEGDASKNLDARGVAFADLDNSGAMDMIVAPNYGPPAVFRNNILISSLNDPYKANNWTTLKPELRGAGSVHCTAWDASVSVTANGHTVTQYLGDGGSYQSSSDPRLHFGLGNASSASVQVTWPDGHSDSSTLAPSDLDKIKTLTESYDAPPPAPGALAATVGSDGNVSLQWAPVSVCDFKEYDIVDGTSADFPPANGTLVAKLTTRDLGHTVLTTLPSKSDLWLEVVAVDAAGQKTASQALEVHTPPKPPARVAVQAPDVLGPTSAVVNWTRAAADDFARYEVHVGPASDFTPNATTLAATVTDEATTTATLTGLLDGATQYVRVVVATTDNTSSVSDAVALSTPDAPPVAPVLTAPPAGITAFNLTLDWSATPPPRHFARYELSSALQSGFAPGGMGTVTLTDPVTQYTFTGLQPGTTYYFRLRVVDAAGLDALSAEFRAATLAVDVPAVTLSAQAVGPGWAVLSWTPSDALGFRDYEIHVAAKSGFVPSLSTEVTVVPRADVTTYNVTGLAPGSLSYARVVVATAYGSAASNEVTLQPPGGDGGGEALQATSAPAAPAASPNASAAPAVDLSQFLKGLAVTDVHVDAQPGGFAVSWDTSRPAAGSVLVDGAEAARDGALRTGHALNVTGLQGGQAYTVTIEAIDAFGATAQAHEQVTTLDLPSLPSPPRNLKVQSDGTGGILLSWDLDAQGLAHVRVYRQVAVGKDHDYGAAVLVAELDPAVHGLRDVPGEGSWIQYRVAAVDAYGRESAPSAASRIAFQTGDLAPQEQTLGATSGLPVPGLALPGAVAVAVAAALLASRPAPEHAQGGRHAANAAPRPAKPSGTASARPGDGARAARTATGSSPGRAR